MEQKRGKNKDENLQQEAPSQVRTEAFPSARAGSRPTGSLADAQAPRAQTLLVGPGPGACMELPTPQGFWTPQDWLLPAPSSSWTRGTVAPTLARPQSTFFICCLGCWFKASS